MSVYIKGRKPPNSCDDCWVSDCPNDEHIDGYRMMDRPTYFPLISVPDHGRLIDTDALFAKIEKSAVMAKQEDNFDSWYACRVAAGFVLNAPTIIPADEQFGNSEQLASKEDGE